MLALCWFRDAAFGHRLALDHYLDVAIAHRYLRPAITALADRAPELRRVLHQRDHTA